MTCKTSTGEEVWLRRMGGKVYCPLPSGYLVPYYVSLRVVLPGFLPLILVLAFAVLGTFVYGILRPKLPH